MINSHSLYEEAKQYIPAGVNSPVRSFKGVNSEPLFIKQGQGAYLTDEDNHRYIDYVCSWGPLILGHAHPIVVNAISQAASYGTSFGAPTAIEVQLAKKVCELMPNIELVRMVNSGTEATLSAIRLARGFTKRDKIIKFTGCYHGHCDALLVKAGSGNLTFGVPDSAGIPNSVTSDTLSLEFNNIQQLRMAFTRYGQEIAAVIVEPVAGNMNCVLPEIEFLTTMRELCSRNDSVLIFDEVITGFRVGLGGAQEHYGIKPDLTTLGKIIGGGLPVGAFGGKREIMQMLSPLGPVYQAGTLSGNPLAMAAGLVTLNAISQPGFYQILNERTQQLTQGLLERAYAHHIEMQCNQIGSMFGMYFTPAPKIRSFDDVMSSDAEKYKKFFHLMLAEKIYFAPSAYEVAFLSQAHQQTEIETTLKAADKVFAKL